MARRRDACWGGWEDDSLRAFIAKLGDAAGALAPGNLASFAERLPTLRSYAGELGALDDTELAWTAGRTYEFAKSVVWVFGAHGGVPTRVWHGWAAKQGGVFFTPEFVARHLAVRVIAPTTETVLDPAVGGAAFLIEALGRLRELGVPNPLSRLYGVDTDAPVVELSRLTLAFLSGGELAEAFAATAHTIRHGDALLARLDTSDEHGSWADWFPAPFSAGGFGAVLMNPPYRQLKTNHTSLPLRPGDSPEVADLRERALALARSADRKLSEALRSHPDYEHAHGGIPDLPRYFIERSLDLLRGGAKLGCIVPSALLADHRSRGVRERLMTHEAVSEVDLIPEDARLFHDVNQPTCLLVVERGGRKRSIRVRRHVRGPDDLRRRPITNVTASRIARIDPAALRIPDCDAQGWAILNTMHRHSRIAEHPWIENLRGELDLTLDQSFVTPKRTGLRLVRGDQLDRYRDDLPSDKPAWVRTSFLRESVSKRKLAHVERMRIAGPQCSYLKKRRRLAFALIAPRVVVANSCNYLVVASESSLGSERHLYSYLLGVINSSLIEWRFRLTSATNHVGNYEIDSLPIPSPASPDAAAIAEAVAAIGGDAEEGNADPAIDELVFRAFGLSAAARQYVLAAISDGSVAMAVAG